MLKCRTIACSFCGKEAAQVAKLVAGPRVYICDVCVAEASRIMKTSDDQMSSVGTSTRPGLAERLNRVMKRWRGLQLRSA